MGVWLVRGQEMFCSWSRADPFQTGLACWPWLNRYIPQYQYPPNPFNCSRRETMFSNWSLTIDDWRLNIEGRRLPKEEMDRDWSYQNIHQGDRPSPWWALILMEMNSEQCALQTSAWKYNKVPWLTLVSPCDKTYQDVCEKECINMEGIH